MAFINLYKPPKPLHRPLGEPSYAPIKVHFNLSIPETLSTDRIKLVPFIPSLHAEIFHKTYSEHPALDEHLPVRWLDYSQFLGSLEGFGASSDAVLFAIIDRTKPNDGENLRESLAGMIGFIRSEPEKLAVEIGCVIILPAWQRTFVSTHAIGSLLQHALNLPSEGGIGLRRVTWGCSVHNKASQRAAERMGFKLEGVNRWSRVFPPGKKGESVDGRRGEGNGLHAAILSQCFDDWENGGRALVEAQMNRE